MQVFPSTVQEKGGRKKVHAHKQAKKIEVREERARRVERACNVTLTAELTTWDREIPTTDGVEKP